MSDEPQIPWCPVCSAWRGYNKPLCDVCAKVKKRYDDGIQNRVLPTWEDYRAVRIAAVSQQRVKRELYTQNMEALLREIADIMRSGSPDTTIRAGIIEHVDALCAGNPAPSQGNTAPEGSK